MIVCISSHLPECVQILLKEGLLARLLERLNLQEQTRAQVRIALEDVLACLCELLRLDALLHKGFVSNGRLFRFRQRRHSLPVSNLHKRSQFDPPEPLVGHLEVASDLGCSVALIDGDQLVNGATDRQPGKGL